MTTKDPPIWFGNDETKPRKGAYLVLWYHHDGESHWCTKDQLRERIRGIRETKPDVDARLARLTAVPWSKTVAAAEKAYDKAVAPAEKARYEAVASARKAYYEAEAAAEKAYDEAVAPALKVYDDATVSTRKAYDEAKAAAWKAYDKAVAPAWKAYDEAVASAGKAFLSKVKIERGNAVRVAEGIR